MSDGKWISGLDINTHILEQERGEGPAGLTMLGLVWEGPPEADCVWKKGKEHRTLSV